MKARDKVPFGDLLLDSKDGEWGEGAAGVGLVAADMIRGTDFAELNNPLKVLPRRYVNEKHAVRKRLQVGDIVFEMAGGTAKQSTGRSALITKDFLEQRGDTTVLCASFCRHLRLDQSKYDPQYVYFVLQALYGAGYMSVFNIQHTGVSRFQYTSFKKHTVLEMPKLESQQKIAAILSAYDDLIANNQRRITLLERMAEDIYREWFVRLRFPGHRDGKVEKGVPRGWALKRLTDVCDITYGYPFQGERFNSVGRGRPIIRIRNIPNASTTDYTDEVVNPKYIVRTGDLLIGMDGEFHINHWIGAEAYLVQRSCRLKSKDVIFEGYLAHAIRAPIEHFQQTILGATVGHLGAKHLNSIEVLVPPNLFLPQLNTLNVLLKQRLQLGAASHQAQAALDALLPRLISGKLAVDELDIRFPPGMEAKG